jgi:CheY-like chemotaxis protein
LLFWGSLVTGAVVYVVDDSKDAADSLASLLEMMGMNARACYSAEQAMELVGLRQPDCVILDIKMTGMQGLEFAQQLRARFCDDIVLVALTGTPKDDPLVQATFNTVDHYFEKPIALAQIKKIFSR